MADVIRVRVEEFVQNRRGSQSVQRQHQGCQ